MTRVRSTTRNSGPTAPGGGLMQVTGFNLTDWCGRQCRVKHEDASGRSRAICSESWNLRSRPKSGLPPKRGTSGLCRKPPASGPFSPGGPDRSSESSFGCHDEKRAASYPPTRSAGNHEDTHTPRINPGVLLGLLRDLEGGDVVPLRRGALDVVPIVALPVWDASGDCSPEIRRPASDAGADARRERQPR